MESTARLDSQLVESIHSIRTIKQFGLEDFANLRTETHFVRLLSTVYKSSLNKIFSTSSSRFLSRVFTIIILWSGSYFVIDNTITTGELLSFFSLIGYLTGPAAVFIGMNKTAQNALIAADRLFEILDIEKDSENNKIDLKKKSVGDVVFNNVSFVYEGKTQVFKNFHMRVKKGQLTAITGESGSGKTTLISLLQKLYYVSEGTICIGDYNISRLTDYSLRHLIAVVPQQLDLFSGNIIENIAIGDFNPDMELIDSICRELGIISFIEGLPANFNTEIGENGVKLSGGQKQRLAIARALYRKPEILLLDEATSSLDSESEKYVQETIKNLRDRGKTIIIIAHRLSTVVNADNIIVLEKGKLIEEGSHKNLYNNKGKYYRLWQEQFPVFIEN